MKEFISFYQFFYFFEIIDDQTFKDQVCYKQFQTIFNEKNVWIAFGLVKVQLTHLVFKLFDCFLCVTDKIYPQLNECNNGNASPKPISKAKIIN